MATIPNPDIEYCVVCQIEKDQKVKWLTCIKCENGAHSTCANLGGIKSDPHKINWVCNYCAVEIKGNRNLSYEMKELQREMKEIKDLLMKNLSFRKISKQMLLPQSVRR